LNFNIKLWIDFTFQKNVEECKSAAEFLLEPWVLLQLPFQPLLLHQWCVALHAESLKFKKEICDFNLIPYPTRLRQVVVKLEQMANFMLTTSDNFFDHFYVSMYTDVGENHDENVSSSFLENLHKVLSTVEFVLSDECRNAVKTLKRLAWNETVQTDIKKIKDEIRLMEAYLSCYNRQMWRGRAAVHCMCPLDRRSKADDIKNYSREKTTAAELEGLKTLVEEKLIKTGRLQGETKEVIFQVISDHCKAFVPYYRAYMAEIG